MRMNYILYIQYRNDKKEVISYLICKYFNIVR
jgi:hypothetical protein